MRYAPHSRQQRGYILALNILILALMFVSVSYMGQRMYLATRLAQAEKERVSHEYALESAKSRILLLLASVPRGQKGLGLGTTNVALDGRQYQLDDNIIVSLQDTRGLVALNGITISGLGRERLERLLKSYGVSLERTSALTDTLLDYRDPDDLKRINGAEKEEYRAAGIESQLRNSDLISTNELSRIFGWSSVNEIWTPADPITRHVSIEKRAAFNPNTADWRALFAMSMLSEEVAKQLVESRRLGQIQDISGLAYAGGIGDPFGVNALVTLFPSATLIVTLREKSQNWGYRMAISHAPDMDVTPWRIESAERISLPPLSKTPLPKLPEISSLRDLSKAVQVQFPI